MGLPFIMAFQDAKKCNAKSKRTGNPCRNVAVSGSTKCRMHGGKTPRGIASPHFKTGANSKFAYLPGNYFARIEKVAGDQIENLEQSIEIQKVLESKYLEKLNSTESTEAWKRLHQAVREYDEATHEAKDAADKAARQAQAFGMIRFIVKEGLSETFLHRDIQAIHETQRKISETISKMRKEQQDIYTREQWIELMVTLAGVLRETIKDRSVLSAIQNKLYELSNKGNKGDNAERKNVRQLTDGR